MDIESIKINFKQILAEDLHKAILNIESMLSQNNDSFDDLIILKSRYNKLIRRELLRISSQENIDIENNKLKSDLISFINHLEEDQFKSLSLETIEKIESINVNFPESKKIKLDREQFHKKSNWKNLVKVGEWHHFKEDYQFWGKGMYSYLLSEKNYGTKNFTIFAKFRVNFLKDSNKEIIKPINAGIVLGWVQEKNYNRYYNLLITGNKILFEGIGLQNGDDYTDFIHLDRGIPFSVNERELINFVVKVSQKNIHVVINNHIKYTIAKPNNLFGKVGIRPWRSQLIFNQFEVTEISL